MGKKDKSSKKEKRLISEDDDEHVGIKKKKRSKKLNNPNESQNEIGNMTSVIGSGNTKEQDNSNNHGEEELESSEKEVEISREKKEEFEGLLNDMDASKLKKVKRSKTEGKTEIEENTKNCDEVEEKSDIHPAIEYLLNWKKNRSEWSFKKVRQVWLLKNLYDESKISNKHFKSLIKYMKDLKGKARDDTLEEARQIMEKEEDSDEIKGGDTVLQRQRASKIVKLLS